MGSEPGGADVIKIFASASIRDGNKSKFLGIGNYTEEGFAYMGKGLALNAAMIKKAVAMPNLKLVLGTDAVAGAHGRTTISRERRQVPDLEDRRRFSGLAKRWQGTLSYRARFQLMAVALDTTRNFEAGIPHPLFTVNVGVGFPGRQGAVAKDGKRFLLNILQQQSSTMPITVVVNC